MHTKNKKTRMTSQKRIILEELAKLSSHPTADEVYKIVKKRLPKISLGTVYRNLEQLSQNNKILKLEKVGSKKRFDGNPNKHYHMRCEKCSKIFDIKIKPIKAIDKALKTISEHNITDYKLNFLGLCKKCNK